MLFTYRAQVLWEAGEYWLSDRKWWGPALVPGRWGRKPVWKSAPRANSFCAASNRSHCHQAKPFNVFPNRDPQNQWQSISIVCPGSLATASGGSLREAGLFFQSFLGPCSWLSSQQVRIHSMVSQPVGVASWTFKTTIVAAGLHCP